MNPDDLVARVSNLETDVRDLQRESKQWRNILIFLGVLWLLKDWIKAGLGIT